MKSAPKSKYRCSVCGRYISKGRLNCEEHSHVIARMVSLVQEIIRFDKQITPSSVYELADKHKCHPNTVRKHLRNEGYVSYRGWKRIGEHG